MREIQTNKWRTRWIKPKKNVLEREGMLRDPCRLEMNTGEDLWRDQRLKCWSESKRQPEKVREHHPTVVVVVSGLACTSGSPAGP